MEGSREYSNFGTIWNEPRPLEFSAALPNIFDWFLHLIHQNRIRASEKRHGEHYWEAPKSSTIRNAAIYILLNPFTGSMIAAKNRIRPTSIGELLMFGGGNHEPTSLIC
jgi:hypothetical protein